MIFGTASTGLQIVFLPLSLLWLVFSWGWFLLKMACLLVVGYIVYRAIRHLLTPKVTNVP